MRRLFTKDQIFTIPNLLSLIRFLMIPVIAWLYCERQNCLGASMMIVLSGLTDVADGFIARKFYVVSDLGKILDPLADKITQAALIVCLITRYERMLWLFILFAVKEIAMGISGLMVIKKKDQVNSSQWFGKLATMVMYTTMFLLFLFPNIPEIVANGMILTCAAVLLLAMVKYLRFHISLLRDKKS